MKEDLREFAGSTEDFEWLFDQFEIFYALSYVDASIAFDEDPSAAERWFPAGRFSRHKNYYDERIKGVDNWFTQAAATLHRAWRSYQERPSLRRRPAL
jgi:hypothetical protein